MYFFNFITPFLHSLAFDKYWLNLFTKIIIILLKERFQQKIKVFLMSICYQLVFLFFYLKVNKTFKNKGFFALNPL